MTTRNTMLKELYMDGWHVFVSGQPIYPNRKDGRWPVMYLPRNIHDPQPWVSVGTEFRYSSEDLYVMNTRGVTIYGVLSHEVVRIVQR